MMKFIPPDKLHLELLAAQAMQKALKAIQREVNGKMRRSKIENMAKHWRQFL